MLSVLAPDVLDALYTDGPVVYYNTIHLLLYLKHIRQKLAHLAVASKQSETSALLADTHARKALTTRAPR